MSYGGGILTVKRIIFSVICLSLVLVFAGCSSDNMSVRQDEKDENIDVRTLEEKMENKDFAEIVMEDGSVMDFELYPDVAPITVANFIKLASEGFYDGLTFHRIISGFMIQGGAAKNGASADNIKGEFQVNGVKNELSHKRGVISMARAQGYNSASTQFFIVHEDSPHLDGNYAAFGMMTSGFEVLDKLAATPTNDPNGIVDENNQPVIKTIIVK